MRLRWIFLPLALTMLAGCGGPSDGEVQQAVRDKLVNQRQSIEALIGKSGANALADLFGAPAAADPASLRIDVGRKTRLDDGTYSAVVTLVGQNGKSDTIAVRLAEAKQGWVVLDSK
jgi:hypothetical protein